MKDKDVPLVLAHLGRALRASSVGTSLRDEMDAASALLHVDREDREEVRLTLRIALRIPRAAFATFDRLFVRVWGGEPEPVATSRRPAEAPPLPRGVALHWNPETRRMGLPPGGSAKGEEPGWSPDVLLRQRPFDEIEWSGAELVAMERLLARLARRLAARRSRRLVPTAARRGRTDLRASFRRALRTSGEMVSLARRQNAMDRPRLVFLLDTSGSMDAHGRFLTTLVLALRRGAPTAELFAFNTELKHLTPSLSAGKLRLTLERVASALPDWSGGTRIGECLEGFVRDHLGRLVDGKTVVIILSDGLDRGDPARLAAAVREISGRARKLVWLNPLKGDERYEPATAGMRAALPYVDHFASAHNLESLERVLPHLGA